MRPLSETLLDLVGFAEEVITRPAKYFMPAMDDRLRFNSLAAEIRKADVTPAEGVRTTRAALVMVIVLEEFLAGDREPTSHFLGHAGITLPWLRGEAWQARRNEKEARAG
jgi:hypothetical protein